MDSMTFTTGDARGRNGWFKPHTAATGSVKGGLVWLAVQSRNIATCKMEPIYIEASPREMRALATNILKAVKEASA